MRSRIRVGVLLALAVLVPAAPAVAYAASSGPNASCQPVERKVYQDIRELVTIDLETASDTDVRLLANQIQAAAKANALTSLPGRLQERLDGPAEDLRAFLRTNLQTVWTIDLRVAVGQTMTGAGANVQAAAQKVLDEGTIAALLAYLNDGLYAARALDCASTTTPPASASTSASPSVPASTSASPSVPASTSASPTRTTTSAPTSPSATSAAPTPTTAASTPAGGSMPVTGTNTGIIATVGGILLFVGGASILLARRRRTVAGD
ncbi:hypothetical protein GCM10009682_10030 [Luedemannella flava]|uniref:LPXTG cell wall anchor domain-containing protein n=1 Tax=Luedemannella flava TaxID=349316 RepID=A0ABP4XP03_9ACTN